MWGSSNELKLRRAERDKSRMESMVLEGKLKACHRSKRCLMEQLSKTEENMLIIIDQYKEGGEPWMTQGGAAIYLLGGRVCCS